MEYVEKNRTEVKIINTTVDFTFTINGETILKEVEISHFNPANEEEILNGISNRYISEERLLNETLDNGN